jgi:hypothetical protein
MAAQFTMCVPMRLLLILALALPVRALSLCDVAANPKAFDGQTLEITAFVSQGFEDSTLFDPRCESMVWVENSPSKSALVHATLRGKFSAGPGFGHMGAFSLFTVDEVVSIDPHDLCRVDYGVQTEAPDADCFRSTFPPRAELLDEQRAADAGTRAWAFRDPRRVAAERVPGVTLRRTYRSRGRMTYEGGGVRVVVSRPYWLSFSAANRKRVAWVVIALYNTNC